MIYAQLGALGDHFRFIVAGGVVKVDDAIITWNNPFQRVFNGNSWQERIADAVLGPLDDDSDDDDEARAVL